MNHKTMGVLSYPKTRLSFWVYWLSKQYSEMDGYAVDAPAALEVLATTQPGAAEWWQKNVPYLMEAESKLFFPANVCRET